MDDSAMGSTTAPFAGRSGIPRISNHVILNLNPCTHMLNPKLFHPIIYATSALLLVAGIGVLYYFLRDNEYFSLLVAGYIVLVVLFLSLKLYFVRLILKPRQPRTPQG